MIVTLDDTTYNVNIERKHNKNLYMRVMNNELFITCPYRMSLKEIENFIYAKQSWIKKHVKMNDPSLFDQESVMLFGKRTEVEIIPSSVNQCLFRDKVRIYTLYTDKTDIEQLFYRYAMHLLNDKVIELRKRWDLVFDRKPVISYKYYKSRWGCCYPARNQIFLNVTLVHYDVDCINSVLLHEYTHFIIGNHSDDFYRIIYNYMPDYKMIHKKLKNS